MNTGITGPAINPSSAGFPLNLLSYYATFNTPVYQVHQGITDEALSFLYPDVLREINWGHEVADFIPANQDDPTFHFDSCNFEETTTKINERYDVVLSLISLPTLNINNPDLTGSRGAFEKFGEILHTSADFYSHSNWVELMNAGIVPADKLIDDGRGKWTVLHNGDLISGTDNKVKVIEAFDGSADESLFRATGSHIINTIHNGKVENFPDGLISGVADPTKDPLSFGNCPNNIALGHWDPYYWISPFYPFGFMGNPERILGNIGTLHDTVGQVVLRNYRNDVHGNPIPLDYRGPIQMSDTQSGLNKDDRSREGYWDARALAVKQTTNEWCRLWNLVETQKGPATAEKLFSIMVQDKARAYQVCGKSLPVSNAGSDQTVNAGTQVTLDGSKSSDAGNNAPLTYTWKLDSVTSSGGGGGTFGSVISSILKSIQGSIPDPEFYTPPISSTSSGTTPEEDLKFQLTVSDGVVDSDPSYVTVHVDGIPAGKDFVVNTNAMDTQPCDDSHCSLLEAITEANANPGRDTIKFNLPSDQLSIPAIGLPEITDPVIIDGTTQVGAFTAGKPIVELNGEGTQNGPVISAGNSIIKGLLIDNYGYGIVLKGSQQKTQTDSNTYTYNTTPTGSNIIEGNYIGTGMDSSTSSGTGNGIGIEIEASKNNQIGGLTPSERNIISGNTIAGIRVIDGVKTQVVQFNTPSEGQFTVTDTGCDIQCASSSNLIQGNYIGTDSTGKSAVPNGLYGVAILRSHDNILGGIDQTARNIISGNGKDGIIISGDISTNNLVEGNYIGVDVDGTNKLPNTEMGVRLTSIIPQTASGIWQTSSGSTTYLGTPALNNIGNPGHSGAQNIISGNGQDGVYIGENALVNQVDGNFIGTDPTGKNAVGNSQNGVAIVGGVGNFIGGLNTDTPLSSIASYDSQNKIYTLNLLAGGFGHGQVHNIISGNGQNGVYINLDSIERDQNGNPVKDSNGNDIKRYVFAIFPTSTSSTTTTGGSGGTGGTATDRVFVANNFVRGNYIGTDISGTSNLGNTADGVAIVDSSKNMVTTPITSDPTPNIADPNIISFNKGNGVSVVSTTPGSATSNNIVGNDILNNGKLGIDLGNDGVTQNHDINNEVDSGVGGPNDFMNYPSGIVFYNSKYNQTIISGKLGATNPSSAEIEVYANTKVNPSGYGEGERLLGYITPNKAGSFIAALGNGNILNSAYNDIFGSKFNDDTSGGNLFPVITATATKNNSTSEFSAEFKHVIPPIANAGHYQRTAEGQIVTLNGTNSTASPLQPGANITSYSWQQIGQQQQNGTILSVLLKGSDTATPKFVAPNVTSPAVLYFRLTVTDSNGATDYDTVPVLVTKASQIPEYCSDNDNDWICNEVDTKPYSFSNDFSDIPLGGTTNGTVAERGSQLFTIKEEPNPNGVRITDFSQALGATDISNIIRAQPQPANFVGCGGAIQFYLHTGDEVILTCGSADLQVIKQNASNPQPITISYHTKGGITAYTSLDAGNKLIFDPITTGMTAPANNSHGIDISTQNNSFILLQPGETVYLSHLPIVNTIITSAKDIRGLPITNGSSTNSSTITFNFKGNISSASDDQITGFDCFLNKDNNNGLRSSLVSAIPGCFNTLRFANIPTGNYTFSVRGFDSHFIAGPSANFTWTANNNSSNATAGPKTITIDPLVANAGSSQTVNQGQKVILQGNNSSSSTNNLTADNQLLFPDYKVSYLWKQIAGPAVMLNGSDTTNPNFIAPILNNTNSNTTLSFELTVSDSTGQVASDRVSILVNAIGNNTNDNGNNPHHLRAIAGPDQTISAASDTLPLTADGTVDSPHHIVSYEWTQVGGPSLALFSQRSNDYIQSSLGIFQPFNGSPITTTIYEFPILDNNTKFTFKLTVVDDTGLNASSTVNVNYVVSPNTHHLLANGGPDQTLFANMSNPGLSFFNRFNLNDYGSSVDNSPPPTQISRSQWLQIGGPPVSLEFDYACAYCFFGEGDTPVGITPPVLDNNKFTFKYSVADDQGEVSSVIKNVYYNISKNTHHLIASAKNTLKYVSEDLGSIPLNANASTVDPPANIVGYQWTQLAGPTVHATGSSLSTAGLGLAKSLNVISLSTSPTTEVFTDQPLSSFANNTKLTFKLTVVDDQGEVSSDTVDVHLVKSSTITADAGPDRIVVNEGQPVTLNGTYNDPALSAGARIILTNWYRIVDNSSSPIRIPKLQPLDSTGLVSTTPTFNFTAPFVQSDTTLKFRFYIEDSVGGSANSNVISVLVKNNASRTIDPPIADAGTYKNAFTEGSDVHLNGANSYDPQNSSLTYSWKQIASQSGALPSYYHLDIQNSNTSTPSFVVPYLPTNATDYTITTADGHILSYAIFNIQLKVTNAAGNSSTDTARIDVLNANHSPTVLSSGRLFSTESRNAFANVQLEGSDPDKDALSFFTLQGPKHGALHMIDGSNITTSTSTSLGSSSVAPTKITSAFNDSSISIAKIIYTPNKNYTGLDSFTYKANDGILDSSNNGTAIINAADHAPAIPLTDQIVNAVSYRDTNITLNAKDPDSSDALTYSILSNPSHGSIIKFDPHTGSLQYRPFGKYSPVDNFTFKANDGLLDSSIGTVTLHINESTTPFSKGDIVAAVGGQLRWYKSDGTFTGHYLFPAVPSKFTTDIAFDPSGSYLYAVQNDSKTITKFDKYGNSLGVFGKGWGNESGPNSLAFDKQGNIYVGPSSSPFGSPLFLKFDPNGNLLKTYTNHGVWSEPNGVEYSFLGALWIELAPDECTMYYSDNDFQIHRYNICTDTQLENFGGNTVLNLGNTVFGGFDVVSYGAAFGELNNAGIICCHPDGAGPLRLLPNGTALMFSISKSPVNGTLSNGITPINSTAASVIYTPKENFSGTDSFTYRANDEETLLLNQGSHIDRVNVTRLCLPVYRTADNAFLGCDPKYASNSYQGHVIQTYKSTSPNSSWFTINLDPNCKSSFWAADVNNGIYKFDIPTGKLLEHINIQSPQGFAVEKGNQGCNNASTNMTTSHLSPTIITSKNRPVNITLNGIINGNNNIAVANPITVKIDVNPFQNHPPVAVNAKASTNEDTPANINVLVNATNPDHNPLSIEAIPTPPKNGTAIINTNNNTITYTPSPHFFGVDNFAYTISDSQGDTSTASVFVTVKHLIVQPVANAGENQTVNENTSGVILNGSKSFDRDGGIVSYLWSQIGGPNVTLSNSSASVTTFTAPSVTNDTNLKFKLTVTDNDNATSSTTTNVLVKNVNLVPISNAGTNQTVNENTTEVTLDGSQSTDRDGTIKSYSWTQTRGPSVSLTGANTSKATFTAPSVRADTTLTFRLTVTDNDDASSSATTNVLVKRVNIPPIAVIVPANQTVNASQIVSLDGSKSYDPDGGTTLSYSWIQTSGPTVTLSGADTAKASFTAPNVTSNTPLTFKLTVKDNDNATSSAKATVLVKNVKHPPIANAGPDQTVNENTTNVTLNGTRSSDPDKNDTIASYSWKQVSGTPIVTLTGANTATPSFTAPSVTADTTLKFNLTVTDNHDATSKPDTVAITIKNVNLLPIANAGTNQTVNENTTGVMLDGSKSLDKDGNITSYNWQQTTGPAVTLSDIHSIKPTFTALSVTNDTLLSFKLTVTDNDNATSSSSTNVLVKNINVAPVANAGANQTVNDNNATNPVILDGTKSYDPDGTIKSYQWTQVSSSPVVQLTGVNTSKAIFNIPHITNDTTLTFKLTVTDNQGAKSAADTSVLIRHVNLPPIAVAGPNQIVNESKTVTLNGTKSSDPDGTIQSYFWTQTSGPKVNLTSANTATPSFAAPHVLANTTLTFNLKVTDNQGANSTNTASTNIIVKHINIPPIADAGTNQTVNGNSTVILDGTKSRDPDGGDISSYQWVQTAGPTVTLTGANTATPSFTAPTSTTSDTTLTFKLIVTDSDGGATSSASTYVLVKRTNVPPIANAGPDQTVNENSTGVILDGSKSTDPDGGKIASYDWTQTSGPRVKLDGSNTATPTFTAPSVKADTTLTFKLTVTDSDGGASSSATTNVIVKHVNIPPTAVITPANQTVNENTTNVILDGSGSSDKDGTIKSYSWTQNSGPSVILTGGKTSKVTFTAPSVAKDITLTFKLAVTDNDNATSSATSNVLVKNVNIPPVANAGTNQTVNENTTGVKLDGSKSFDRDGTIASYNWQQTSGPTVTFSSPNSASTTFTAPSVTADTTLTFKLTVTDNNGASSSATSNVLVKNVNLPPVANAGASQTVNEGTANIKLDGTKSFDPDKGDTITSYTWTQTAGPTITLANANTATPTFTAPQVNADTTLTFSLKVTDNHGAASTNTATSNVLVKNVNQPPVAKATVLPSSTVNGGTVVTLDGSGSSEPDGGSIASYQWVQTAGPTITLQGANIAKATFTAPSNLAADTTYAFKLTVTDSDGGLSSSIGNVNVVVLKATMVNHPPDVSKAAPSQGTLWPPDHKMVSISIQNIKDPDNDLVTIKITKIMQDEPVNGLGDGDTAPDGSGIGTSTAQVRAERDGNADGRVYHISFVATDSKGAQSNGEVVVSVPHDQAHQAIDEGSLYDSTVIPSSSGKAKMASMASSPTTSSPPLTPSPSSGLGPSPSISNASNNKWTTLTSNNNANLGSANAKNLGTPSSSSLSSQQQLQQSPYPYQNHYPYSHPSSPFPYYQSQQQPSRIQHTNQPPIANAGMSQTVYSGSVVMLDGRNSYDPDNYAVGINYGGRTITNNGIAAYQWTQVQISSNTGVQTPIIILQGANTATPTFVSPVLPYDITLPFSLKVMDSDGGTVSSNPAIVYVMVKHNPNLNFNNSPTNSGGSNNLSPNKIQPQQQQQQQPISPSQPNSATSISPPQIGSSNIQNAYQSRIP